MNKLFQETFVLFLARVGGREAKHEESLKKKKRFFWSAAPRLLNVGFLSLCSGRLPWVPPARKGGGGGVGTRRSSPTPTVTDSANDRLQSLLHASPATHHTTKFELQHSMGEHGPRLLQRGNGVPPPRLLLSPVQPGTTWRRSG